MAELWPLKIRATKTPRAAEPLTKVSEYSTEVAKEIFKSESNVPE